MSIDLTDCINHFFELSNGADLSQVALCFTQDAIVTDEKIVYQGQEAIAAWLKEARQKFQFTVTPLITTEKEDFEVVTAKVAGNFPSSPAKLTYNFLLHENKIQSLEIF